MPLWCVDSWDTLLKVRDEIRFDYMGWDSTVICSLLDFKHGSHSVMSCL